MLGVLALSTVAALASPKITWFDGSDNVYARARWKSDTPSDHIVFLGEIATPAECGAACVAEGSGCRSFVHHGVDPSVPSFTHQCFGVMDCYWSPKAVPHGVATTGRVRWPAPTPPCPAPAPPPPCKTDAGCSLNGHCGAGGCRCDAAWTGDRCELLNLAPATRGAGLHTLEPDGHNTSTWGGTVLRDNATGTYHMWAAEMIRHCGINTWTCNSRIVHATSATATGKYTRQGEVFGIFSHEPNAVRDPETGEWALFFTAHMPAGSGAAPHGPPQNCTDGSTFPSAPAVCNGANEGATYVAWSKGPEGPWSKPVQLISVEQRQSDTNLAPVLLPGGRLVGIWRVWAGGSWPHLVTATNWKDPSTYTFHNFTLFPELRSSGTEDPAVYLDAAGRFHALFHNMQPVGNNPATNLGHAFSENGLDWTYSGVAGNSSGTYADGSAFSFSRRERPHPVFAPDGTTIVAVTNGVAYKDTSTVASDAVFTFLQPVHTA